MSKELYISKHGYDMIFMDCDSEKSYPYTYIQSLIENKIIILFTYLLGIPQYKIKEEQINDEMYDIYHE